MDITDLSAEGMVEAIARQIEKLDTQGSDEMMRLKRDLEMPYNVTKQPFFLSSEIWTGASMVSNILREIKQKLDGFDVLPYVENIESIAIIVNCFPDEMLRDGWGKPRKYISYQKKYADIRLPIPYDSFVHADYETKYRMVVDNIVQSIRVIDEKCRKANGQNVIVRV